MFRAGFEGALSLWFPPKPRAPQLPLDAQGHTHPQERDVETNAQGRGRVLGRILQDKLGSSTARVGTSFFWKAKDPR